MKRIHNFLVVGALLGGLVACSGDSPSEPASQLSQQEVEEVMQAAFEAVAVAMGGSMRVMPGMDRIAAVPINMTGPCPLGGSVGIDGDITDNVNQHGTGKVQIEMAVSWLDCVVQTSARKLQLKGGYNVDAEFNYLEWETVGDIRFEMNGNFTWKGSGKTGSCPFQVLFLYDDDAGKVSVNGNSCGRTINFSSDDWQ